jgi:predicted nicotinamide N-methyase
VDIQLDESQHQRTVRLTLPASENEVLDFYIEQGLGDADPFWSAIWPSSIALARFMLRQPHLVRGKRVIDIGCGLGLGGIGAVLAGAASVQLADREPLALHCALQSAEDNGLFPLPLGAAAERSVEQQAQLQRLLGPAAASLGTVTATLLDWHNVPASMDASFDVALCADVLYDKAAAEPVAALVHRLLKPGGTLVLADPPARTPKHRERMLAALRMTQTLDETASVVPAEGGPAVTIVMCAFTNDQPQ